METIYEIVRIKQVVREVQDEMPHDAIRSPQDAFDIACHFIGDDDREVFLVMCLNTKNNVIAVHRCHVGALDSSLVNVRETYKSAILNNAKSIIVGHQHPSGLLSPSSADIQVTQRLKKAGEILDIPLLDHVIVNYKGQGRSLKEMGYMN